MKKIILLLSLLIVGWIAYDYSTAAWTRTQFTQEVDSLLASPRGLSEASLIPLIINKADQLGLTVRPEDVQMQFSSSDHDTTTSRLLDHKGFKVEVQLLTLHVKYAQTVLGTRQVNTLDRERTFTAQIIPPSQVPLESSEAPSE